MFELPTEIGLPNFDIGAILSGIYQFVATNGPKFFSWLVDMCGGNPIIAGIVVGFPVYLVLDFFYHTVLDKPAASIGERIMKLATSIVVFIILFFLVYFMWK